MPWRGSKIEIGSYGENLAFKHLRKKGYKLITANWKCKAGEIDLIMMDKKELVFVEVRVREETTYGKAEETVARQKQRKLIKAAQWYMQKADFWGDARFDVVAIEMKEGKYGINHIMNAFMAS